MFPNFSKMPNKNNWFSLLHLFSFYSLFDSYGPSHLRSSSLWKLYIIQICFRRPPSKPLISSLLCPFLAISDATPDLKLWLLIVPPGTNFPRPLVSSSSLLFIPFPVKHFPDLCRNTGILGSSLILQTFLYFLQAFTGHMKLFN